MRNLAILMILPGIAHAQATKPGILTTTVMPGGNWVFNHEVIIDAPLTLTTDAGGLVHLGLALPVQSAGTAVGTVTGINFVAGVGVTPVATIGSNGYLNIQDSIDTAVVQTIPAATCAGCAVFLMVSTPTTPPLNCVFSSNTTQIVVNCSTSGSVQVTNYPVPIPSPGTVGTYGMSGNIVTWSFAPWNAPNAAATCPAGVAAGTCWQVATNGVSQSGSF